MFQDKWNAEIKKSKEIQELARRLEEQKQKKLKNKKPKLTWGFE
jgi:hypothetical protein